MRGRWRDRGHNRVLPSLRGANRAVRLRAVAFDLSTALGKVRRPGGKPSTKAKRQYSDDLSRVFSEALEQSMRTHFPKTTSGHGTGTGAASAAGIKSVDVAFNIEGLFLGLGLSVKVVGLPEGDRGYTHNFKRVTEEWTLETVNYHRYMPYSVIVGMLFLPADCMRDRKKRTSLSTALEHFGPHRGRSDHRDDPDLMEEIYIGVYEPDGSNKGKVFFLSAEHDLGPRALPSKSIRLTFEDVKKELVARFKDRNRKLKVQGMP
jgi:hypothetical protein